MSLKGQMGFRQPRDRHEAFLIGIGHRAFHIERNYVKGDSWAIPEMPNTCIRLKVFFTIPLTKNSVLRQDQRDSAMAPALQELLPGQRKHRRKQAAFLHVEGKQELNMGTGSCCRGLRQG